LKTKLSIVAALAVVVMALSAAAGLACDKSTAQAKAADTALSCDDVCCPECCKAAAAAVTANAKDCCKATVASYLASCSPGMKSASSQGGCSRSAATAAAADLKPCCRETLAALNAAYAQTVASCTHASRASLAASDHCKSQSAAAAKVASSGCCAKQSTAAATVASNSCARSAAAGTIACDKTKSASAAAVAGGSHCSGEKSAKAAEFAKIDADAGKKIVLTGNALCEGCDLKWSEKCNTAFKTADGKIYRLINNDMTKKLRGMDAKKSLEIVTKVVEVDGEKYLEVREFTAL